MFVARGRRRAPQRLADPLRASSPRSPRRSSRTSRSAAWLHAARRAGRLHRGLGHRRDLDEGRAGPDRLHRLRRRAPSASSSACARRGSACGCARSARTRSRPGGSACGQPDRAPRLRRRLAPHVPRRDRAARPARRRRPRAGHGYTLTSITAVVLGGTSLLGGRGTFIGTLLGAGLSVQVLNATVFLSLDQTWQYVFQGLLIVAAAIIYSQVRRRGDALDARR